MALDLVGKEGLGDSAYRIHYRVFIHPDEREGEPGYDEYQLEKKIRQAYADVVEEGAAKVKLALQAYVFVAEQFATGPLYNLAGTALVALATKADDLLRAAQALRAIATKLRGTADDVLAHVNFLKQKLLNAADDLKPAIQAGIRKLEEGIVKLRGAADDAAKAADNTEDVAVRARIEADCARAEPGAGGITPNCFVAGTLVRMADGINKRIEDIVVGDHVDSRDEASGKTLPKRVLRVFSREVSEVVALRISDGLQVECTPEHPFFVRSKGFVLANSLSVGTDIVSRFGLGKIVEVVHKKGLFPVYNFEVEDFHTYFVGQSALWTHNTCGFAPGEAEAAFQNMRGGGGHAIRYFEKLGLISKTGTLESRVQQFKQLTTPILENPTHTFDWAAGGPGGTACKAFVGYANGQRVVIFVAKEGPYQGSVLAAWEVTAANAAKYGI